VTPLSAGWKLLCPIEYRGEHELDDPDLAQELVSQIRAGPCRRESSTGDSHRRRNPAGPHRLDSRPHIVDALPQRYELMEMRLIARTPSTACDLRNGLATNSEPQLIRRIVAYRDRWNIVLGHQRATRGASA